MILRTERTLTKSPTTNDPDSKSDDVTTETSRQNPNEQGGSNQDADSNPSLASRQDESIWKTTPVPCVDHVVRPTHEADDLQAPNGGTLWIIRKTRTNRKQARMIAKHTEGRWTKFVSDFNPAISTKQGELGRLTSADRGDRQCCQTKMCHDQESVWGRKAGMLLCHLSTRTKRRRLGERGRTKKQAQAALVAGSEWSEQWQLKLSSIV